MVAAGIAGAARRQARPAETAAHRGLGAGYEPKPITCGSISRSCGAIGARPGAPAVPDHRSRGRLRRFEPSGDLRVLVRVLLKRRTANKRRTAQMLEPEALAWSSQERAGVSNRRRARCWKLVPLWTSLAAAGTAERFEPQDWRPLRAVRRRAAGEAWGRPHSTSRWRCSDDFRWLRDHADEKSSCCYGPREVVHLRSLCRPNCCQWLLLLHAEGGRYAGGMPRGRNDGSISRRNARTCCYWRRCWRSIRAATGSSGTPSPEPQ